MSDWVYIPNKDSPQGDVKQMRGLSVDQMKAEAENLGVACFNKDGWLKRTVRPTTEWSSNTDGWMWMKAAEFERAKERGIAAAKQAVARGGQSEQSWRHGKYMVTTYWGDIPHGYRLMSRGEWNSEACRALAKRDPGGWAIAMLSDGKCDGHGYSGPGGGTHSMTLDEIQKHTMYTMGDVMLVEDDAGGACEDWASSILDRMHGSGEGDQTDKFAVYTREIFESKGGVLVCSCPGDQHGGMHSRVKNFTESRGWDYAPVQFDAWSREALEWFKYWKINVEKCLTHSIRGGKRYLLEVKVNGGGAGCERERSKNMTTWWVDCIKRMGRFLYQEMRKAGRNPIDVGDGTQLLVVGQVILDEDDYTSFTREGARLNPARGPDGVDMAVHYLLLNGAQNWWAVITNSYASSGGKWKQVDSKTESGGF